MSVNAILVLLAAGLPLAAVGWFAATLAEKLRIDARTRGRLWSAAIMAPLALAPAILLAQVLRPASPPPPIITSPPIAVAPPVAEPAAQAPVAPSTVASRQGPPYAELTLALLVGGVLLHLGVWVERRRRAMVIRHSAEPVQDAGIGALLVVQAARLGVKPPELRLWDGAQPVLVGMSRPTILLPRRLATELEPGRLGLILAHELGHLRASDPWRMALAELTCALLWFNPFVRAACTGLGQAREEICDAAALQGLGRPMRRAYAETLLTALQQQAGESPALAFIGRRRQAVQRMAAILKPRPAAPRRAALCAGAGALALTGSLGGLAYGAAGMLPAPMRPAAGETARAVALVESSAPQSGSAQSSLDARTTSAASPVTTASTAPSSAQLQSDRARVAGQLLVGTAALQQALAAAQEARGQYNVGQITATELLSAEDRLRVAQRDLAQLQASKAQLDLSEARAVGASASQIAALTHVATNARAASDAARLLSAQSAVARAQRNLNSAQANYDLGLTTRSEVEQARLDLVKAQVDLGQIPVGQVPAAQLAQAMIPSAPLVAIPPPPPPPPPAPSRSPPAVYTVADWVAQPTSAQVEAVYPSRARDLAIGGSATLVCQVSVQGMVSGCRVTVESPPGEGFGAAALRLQQYFRMRPKLDLDGQPVAGTATIPFRFNPPAAGPSAQSAPPPAEVRVTPRPPAVFTSSRLIAQPTAQQVTAVYPARAGSDGIGGTATLNCQTDVQGKVSGCRVTAESPPGQGFGAAALRLQQYFAVTPKLMDGQPIPDSVTIPISFQPPQPSPGAP